MKKLSSTVRVLMLGLAMTIIVPSCVNLDEELFDAVTPENFFKTPEEFIAALGAAYTSLYGYNIGSDVNALAETSTDEMTVPTRGQDWDDGGHWRRLHLHSWNWEDPVIGGGWNFGFSGVNNVNRLIFQFNELVGQGLVSQTDADAFIAELKVLRAFYYYWLLDLYGQVPIVTQFADADPTPASNTRQQVFDFVASELNENVPKLSQAVDGSTYGRMNYWAGKAIQAKLYLNAGVYTGTPRWAETIAACDEIINSGRYSLEANFFINFNLNSEVSKEIIFAIPFDKVFAQGFVLPMRTLHYGSQDTYNLTAQPWNGFCSLEEFYNSFEDDDVRKGDAGTLTGPAQRRGSFVAGFQYKSNGEPVVDSGYEPGLDLDGPQLNFTPQISQIGPGALRQQGVRIGKWEFEIGGTPDMSNDLAVFRLADVLLMKAEALWRQSQNPAQGEALALVNQVRSRAAVSDLSTLDGPVSFDITGPVVPGGELLNERGREMFAEGFRRQDLIRWGLFTSVDKWALPIGNPGDRIETGSFTNLYPIPRGQKDANPNLQQNPGYPGGGPG